MSEDIQQPVKDAFISYNKADEMWAKVLAEKIERETVDGSAEGKKLAVFFAPWDIAHGQNFVNRLNDGLRQALPAEFAHPFKVGRRQSGSFPFAESKLGRADFDPVVVVRAAIAKRGPARWVDLAAFGIMLVHGGLRVQRQARLSAVWGLAVLRHQLSKTWA
jgi:hypothetical protein